jgi:hypothetical protein
MSERTAPAIAILDRLLAELRSLPAGDARETLIAEAEALQRAVASFHMEAIRFRMFSVERLLRATARPAASSLYDDLRTELEHAGFHTRSHAAP